MTQGLFRQLFEIGLHSQKLFGKPHSALWQKLQVGIARSFLGNTRQLSMPCLPMMQAPPSFPRHKGLALWKLNIRFHLAGWHQLVERQQLQRRSSYVLCVSRWHCHDHALPGEFCLNLFDVPLGKGNSVNGIMPMAAFDQTGTDYLHVQLLCTCTSYLSTLRALPS